MDKLIDDLLKFDALDTAERLTGKTVDDETTKALGIGMFLAANETKRKALEAVGDSHFGCNLAQFIAIAETEGFEKALEFPFTGREGQPETMFVFWKADEGILLHFESYGGTGLNGGRFSYCWKPTNPDNWKEWSGCTSSGGWANGVWVGYHDCREGMRHNIQKLRDKGQFINDWPEDHGALIWLSCYTDWPTQSRNETEQVREARISTIEARFDLLPEAVRKAIKGVK